MAADGVFGDEAGLWGEDVAPPPPRGVPAVQHHQHQHQQHRHPHPQQYNNSGGGGSIAMRHRRRASAPVVAAAPPESMFFDAGVPLWAAGDADEEDAEATTDAGPTPAAASPVQLEDVRVMTQSVERASQSAGRYGGGAAPAAQPQPMPRQHQLQHQQQRHRRGLSLGGAETLMRPNLSHQRPVARPTSSPLPVPVPQPVRTPRQVPQQQQQQQQRRSTAAAAGSGFVVPMRVAKGSEQGACVPLVACIRLCAEAIASGDDDEGHGRAFMAGRTLEVAFGMHGYLLGASDRAFEQPDGLVALRKRLRIEIRAAQLRGRRGMLVRASSFVWRRALCCMGGVGSRSTVVSRARADTGAPSSSAASEVSTADGQGVRVNLRLQSAPESEETAAVAGCDERVELRVEDATDILVVSAMQADGERASALFPLEGVTSVPSVITASFVEDNGTAVVGMVTVVLSIEETSACETQGWKVDPSANAAYDVLHDVATTNSGFGRRQLTILPRWNWLLNRFQKEHGISNNHIALLKLDRITHIATHTADCLLAIADLLPDVLEARRRGALASTEVHALDKVCNALDHLLAGVIEHYKLLDDSTDSGVVDGCAPLTETPAPALICAIELYGHLHDLRDERNAKALEDLFRKGDMIAYRRAVAASQEAMSEGGPNDEHPAAANTLLSLARLTQQLRSELYHDMDVEEKGVLPGCVHLSKWAAEEYCSRLTALLKSHLDNYPVEQPDEDALALMEAMCDMEEGLDECGLTSMVGKTLLDSHDIFSPTIKAWADRAREQFCEARERLVKEISGRGAQTSVDELYDAMQRTLRSFERVVKCFRPEANRLEKLVADTEQEVLAVLVNRAKPHLGMRRLQQAEPVLTPSPSKQNKAAPRFNLRSAKKTLFDGVDKISKMNPWAKGDAVGWSTVPQVVAMVLNAEHAMQTQRKGLYQEIFTWAEQARQERLRPSARSIAASPGADSVASFASSPGGASLVGGMSHNLRLETLYKNTSVDIRSSYDNLIERSAAQLATHILGKEDASIRLLVARWDQDRDPGRQTQPLEAEVRVVATNLGRELGPGRAFVTIVRKLWSDLADSVKDSLRDTDDLKENWGLSRKLAAAAAVDSVGRILREVLKEVMQSDLRDGDHKPPRSAEDCAVLLGDPSESYNPY